MYLFIYTFFTLFILNSCFSKIDVSSELLLTLIFEKESNLKENCNNLVSSLSLHICFSGSSLSIFHESLMPVSVELSFNYYPKEWNLLLESLLERREDFVSKRSLYKYVSFNLKSHHVRLLTPGDSPESFLSLFIQEQINQNNSLEIKSYHSFIPQCNVGEESWIHLFDQVQKYNKSITWNLYTPRNSFMSSRSCIQDVSPADSLHILNKGEYAPLQLFSFESEDIQRVIICFFSKSLSWTCFVIDGRPFLDDVHYFFNQLLSLVENKNFSRVEKKGDILISEILWMGATDNLLKRHPFDEAFEIYNSSDKRVSLEELYLVCRKNLDDVSLIVPFSPYLVIEPFEYFVVTSHLTKHLTSFDFQTHYLGSTRSSFQDSTTQCALWKSEDQNIHSFSDIYQQGVIIDILGNKKESWGRRAHEYTSKYGFKSRGLDFLVSVRSLERDMQNLGETYTNNMPVVANQWVVDSFQNHTFHSLGFENKRFYTQVFNISLIISEVLAKGIIQSIDGYSGVDRQDVFIEFYNMSNHSILMNDLYFSVWSGLENLYNISFPIGFELESKGFLGVKRFANRGISSKMLVNSQLHFSDDVTHITLNHKVLNNILDQVGSSLSQLKNFSGFFYRKDCDFINCASVRSIEREVNFLQAGNLSSSWHMNFLLNFSDDYQYIFATPMQKNSERKGEYLHRGEIIFSEVHWSGFRTEEGFRDKEDVFIELYNNSSRRINLQFVQIQFLLQKQYGDHFLFEEATFLEPNSRLVLYKKDTSNFRISDQYYFVSEIHLTSYGKKLQIIDAYGNIIDQLLRNRSWQGGTGSFPVRSLFRNLEIDTWVSHGCVIDENVCTSPGE